MLKVNEETLQKMEEQHPGIRENIRSFEQATLPACTRCGSSDTADVQIGVIGRTIYIATATTRFKLIPNGPKPGSYFCNACAAFFGVEFR